MKTLQELYGEHAGKVSDKWSLYLVEYERLLAAYRDRPVELLEIGIQNGGSLEIWSRYFPDARTLVGCDINPDCSKLTYADPRIHVVVGDANRDETEQSILRTAERFDVIIDDGSHRSSDIVRSFARYFPRLADGGVYIIEDLHCSYWKAYEGGLHDATSALAFFKAVSDGISHEHWGLPRSRIDELAPFSERYRVLFDEEVLRHVHSVELINSMCVVRKAAPQANVLGTRVIAGTDAVVMPQVVASSGTCSTTPPQVDGETLRGTALVEELDALRAALLAKDGEVNELRRTLHTTASELSAAHHSISLMTHSASWKLTTPIRETSRLVRQQFRERGPLIYNRIPGRYQERILKWGYRNLAPLFEGHPDFEHWRQTKTQVANVHAHAGKMVDISSTVPAETVRGTIAIHLHVYYEDLAEELRGYVANMPFDYDLYVTVASSQGEAVCRRVFKRLERMKALHVVQVPNRGRDIAAMFCTYGKALSRYDFVAHLHSKKSLYNKGATDGWRQYLATNLLGSEEQIRKIFGLMTGDEPRGIVYPQNFYRLWYTCNTWLANKPMGRAWCTRLGLPMPEGYFDFPAGSMFWARGDALQPLFDAGITIEDFAVEAGQTDGTFAHCLERMLVLSSLKQGMRPGVLADTVHATWSAWRFDQYLGRTREHLLRVFASTETKLIAFDIYDTLLSRPLLDAESVKKLVARRIGDDAGRAYLEHRALAEAEARQAAGRDVGLDAIYARFEARAKLPAAIVATLRALEEEIERASVRPRSDLVALFHEAVRTGKPVVLITDMFLPRSIIEAQLREYGIEGWDSLLISNEVGLRKDTGQLYEHLYARYGIEPAGLLMLGDNERSDIQIPYDQGSQAHHVLKPLEMARGWPRFAPLIEAYEHTDDLDAELTLGLVVRRSFSSFVPPHPDPASLVGATPFALGYGLAGPLLVSFSEWLLDEAKRDETKRLYFVAREGQLMKRVYDAWTAGRPAPASRYLVLSRRAVGVPLLESFEDILTMARPDYWPSPIEDFLRERFGLELDSSRWTDLGWSPSRTIEIRRQDLAQVTPLLMALTDEILAQARLERAPLDQYLADLQLDGADRVALVDVGYSGTIQTFLNRLLPRPVNGYYMMTNDRPQKKLGDGIFARGCFVDGVEHREGTGPLMYQNSFELEKLLSSDDPQILRYEATHGRATPVFRALSADELATASVRAAVQEGVMRFVADARSVRELVPAFQPSTTVAQALFEAFVGQSAPSEVALLRSIALDDHHHGRGVVR